MRNIHHTAYQSSTHTELRLANIKFKSQILLEVALQKIPTMVPATIKSIFKPNHVLAININRMIYHVHMPLLLYYVLTIYSLLSFYHNFVLAKYLLFKFSSYCIRSACITTTTSYRFRGRTCMQCPRTRIPRGRPKKEHYRRGEARQHAPRAQDLYAVSLVTTHAHVGLRPGVSNKNSRYTQGRQRI